MLRKKKISKKIRKVKYPLIFKSSYKKQAKLIRYCCSQKEYLKKVLEYLKNNQNIDMENSCAKLTNLKISNIEECEDFLQFYGKIAALLHRASKLIFIPVTKAPFYLNIVEFFFIIMILLFSIKNIFK